MHRILAIIVTIIIPITLFTACLFQKSDEELIEARINRFLTAYNTGDLDAVIECLDAKTRNTYKSTMNLVENIGGALLGKVTETKIGLNLSDLFDFSDLFGISVGTISEDDILTVDIQEIIIEDETHATVNVTISYNTNIADLSEDAYFTMLKENGDWYIKNLEG